MSVFESTSGMLTDMHDAIGNMSVNFHSRVLFLCSLDAVLTAGRSNWLSAQYSHSTVTVVATLLCLLRSSKPSWLPGEEDFGSVSQFHSSFDLNLPVVYPRAHFTTAVLVQIQPFRFSIKVLSCKQLETAGFRAQSGADPCNHAALNVSDDMASLISYCVETVKGLQLSTINGQVLYNLTVNQHTHTHTHS